jgi:type IV pilus assembly protein PilO
MALGLLIAAVNYCYFLVGAIPFAYKAKAGEIKELQAEYGKLSTEINQARRLAADLERVEKLHSLTQRKWEIANELLPPRTDMAGLLRSVTLAGHTTGVEFIGFEPNDSRNQEYYAENPVKVSVVGSYHSVGAFLGQIAELPRLVTVRMPKIQALKGGDETETVTAEFMASAYSVTGDHVRA